MKSNAINCNFFNLVERKRKRLIGNSWQIDSLNNPKDFRDDNLFVYSLRKQVGLIK